MAEQDQKKQQVSDVSSDESDTSRKDKKKRKDKKQRDESSNTSISKSKQSERDQDKDKVKKKKDKHKHKNKSKGKKKDKKNKSKSARKGGKIKRSGSTSEDSDEDESDHWSAGDSNVDYGNPVLLSDDSDVWADHLSQELYDSDNPDCPLNAYHIESRPRLLKLEDFDEKICKPVNLLVDCLTISDQNDSKKKKKPNKADGDDEVIDHKSF